MAGASPVRNGAWLTFSSIMLLMLTGGTIYAFGLWSPVLKEVTGYGLDQVQVSSLALCANLGAYVVLDIGLFVMHFGTIAGLVLGCFLASTGYFCMFLATDIYNGELPFLLLGIFCFIYGHGCGAIVNSSMTELIMNFEAFAGCAAGCMKAWYGLATATMTVVFYAAFEGLPSHFLLFLSVYTAIAGVMFIPVVHGTRGRVDEKRSTTVAKFQVLSAGIAGLAVLCFVLQGASLSLAAWRAVLAVLLCLVLAPFMLVLGGNRTEDALLSGSASKTKVEAVATSMQGESGMGVLGRLDFYILMLALILSEGSGLLVISNSAQLVPAFGGTKEEFRLGLFELGLAEPEALVEMAAMEGGGAQSSASFVGMLSVFGCFGRLVFGGFSDMMAASLNRPWWLVAAAAIIGSGHLVLYLDGPRLLWPASAAIAFGYGGVWGMQAALVKELFGLRDFSVKLAWVALAALVGSLVFGTLLAGGLYDREARALGSEPYCLQPSCFETSFLVCAACSLPAVLLSVWLARRTSWLYEPCSSEERPKGQPSYGAT